MSSDHPPLPELDRPLTEEELRHYLAHYILHRKFNPDLPFRIGEFQHHVAGPNTAEAAQIERINGGSTAFSNRINQICWEWVRLGLIVPGTQIGAFIPTESGTEVLQEEVTEMAPLLRHGGIASLLQDTAVTELVVAYADEAQKCFAAGLYQAAAVMLGVASESLLIDLVAVLQPLRKQLGLPNLSPRANIRDQIEWLKDAFQEKAAAIRSALTAAAGSTKWVDDLGGLLAETNAIRFTRNTAGHPSMIQVRRRDIFSLIVLFPRLATALTEVTLELGKIQL